MPPLIIYGSPLAPVEIKSSSIFTYLFSDKVSLDDSSAYIDTASGTRMSRFETHDLSLRVAYSVKQRGGARGDVAMIFRYSFLSYISLLIANIISASAPILSHGPDIIWSYCCWTPSRSG
jgi:hypothetical protein